MLNYDFDDYFEIINHFQNFFDNSWIKFTYLAIYMYRFATIIHFMILYKLLRFNSYYLTIKIEQHRKF